MFDFGISGYRPAWLSGYTAIAAAHGPRLAALAGRRLTRVWLVWDLDEDEWFADCPVLLDFEGERLEINHWKFDELSITWNTVDPATPVKWPEFRLAWKADAHARLAALAGSPVECVELLEWAGGDVADGMIAIAIAFAFSEGWLTVHNALDENGLDFDAPDPRYCRDPVA